MMTDNEESLVMRRSKRSTAGNRMAAALAEFKAEDIGMDQEEDVDFTIEKDEEDMFESDFESTDEEGAQEDVDAIAEKIVRDEEKSRKRPGGKSQLERITAAAAARQAATFNPQLHVDLLKKTRPKRRVSMGVAVDTVTGEVVEVASPTPDAQAAATRMSRRKSTILSRTTMEQRLKDAEKKSVIYKKPKIKTKVPTQAELIQRALDMEEGNIIEHREYLSVEEEKRRKARVLRKNVEGPLLRWVSKVEKIKVEVPPPLSPPAPAPVAQMQYAYSYPGVPPPSGSVFQVTRPSITPVYYTPSASTPTSTYTSQYQYPYPPVAQAAPYATSSQPPSATSPYSYYPQHSGNSTNYVPPPAQSLSAQTPAPSTSFQHPRAQTPSQLPSSLDRAPEPPKPEYRIERVSKNYLIHELSQEDDAPRPPWAATMRAIFGDHVNWEEVRVYVGKGRPLSRPIPTCPITGRPARYFDPRTGVPYADKYAWDTLTNIIKHHYVWSENMGCYVGYMPIPDSQERKEEEEGSSNTAAEKGKAVEEAAEIEKESASSVIEKRTAEEHVIGRKRTRASFA